jgi:branched-chain amino acid transport system permease protein
MQIKRLSGRTYATLMVAWIVAMATFSAVVESSFLLTLAGYTSAFALFALSINVMLGGTGEVPLGQCLFFGIGAYSVGIAMKKLGLSFEMGLLIGMAGAALTALVIGALTLRLTGAYFSIVSWGISSVAVVCALNLGDITGGGLGLFGFPRMTFVGLDLGQPQQYFIACTAVLVVAIVLLNAVRTSRFGAAMECVRQNPHLASSLGVDAFRQRIKAFVLSAVLAAAGGALSVPYTQIVTPELLSVSLTVDALLMVLLGGTQLLFGPVIGALIFSIIPQFLEMDANVRILIFSTAIILIMMFAPGGLHELGLAIVSKLKEARFARTQRHKP